MLRTLLVICAVCAMTGGRYMFFRSMNRRRPPTRRIFGGTEARSGSWPRACALLEVAMVPRCSCAVLTPRWAITAAHCAKPEVDHVQYNGLELQDSDLAKVDKLYQHPEFQAVTKPVDGFMDVELLRHDVGLVRTRTEMRLRVNEHWLRTMPGDPVADLSRYDVSQLRGQEVDVLGFGMTSNIQKPVARHLLRVRLLLQDCARPGWSHCACAVGAERGVCAGDSGGPVLYNGTQVEEVKDVQKFLREFTEVSNLVPTQQIGVTSLGPLSCGGVYVGLPVASVFTVLQPYASVINATLDATPGALRMREVQRSVQRSGTGRVGLGVVLLCTGLFLCM